jgi:hypothetical protein
VGLQVCSCHASRLVRCRLRFYSPDPARSAELRIRVKRAALTRSAGSARRQSPAR